MSASGVGNTGNFSNNLQRVLVSCDFKEEPGGYSSGRGKAEGEVGHQGLQISRRVLRKDGNDRA